MPHSAYRVLAVVFLLPYETQILESETTQHIVTYNRRQKSSAVALENSGRKKDMVLRVILIAALLCELLSVVTGEKFLVF